MLLSPNVFPQKFFAFSPEVLNSSPLAPHEPCHVLCGQIAMINPGLQSLAVKGKRFPGLFLFPRFLLGTSRGCPQECLEGEAPKQRDRRQRPGRG